MAGDEAHDLFQEALTIDPALAEAMFNDGVTLYLWGAAERDPNNCDLERTRELWNQAAARFATTATMESAHEELMRQTRANREFLREALRNPSPCHKIRSEFLATMCFAHLMPAQDIETVLDNRLAEIAGYQEMFRQFENEALCDWPEGQKFVLGFGKAIAGAMKKYISENRHLVTTPSSTKAATG